MEKHYITLLKELIRNKCVNDGSPESGNEMKSVRTLKKFFDTYRIKSEILKSGEERGNILIRIPGTDPHAPSLMFMSHLDVVPADDNEWSCDPFSADERGGYIWGRGTLDMLNIVACSACAFADCLKTSRKFPGDFIFLSVADEEASGRLGARWLVENHWKKVRTNYLISEGGGFFINGKKGTGITITTGEKGLAWTRLTTEGISGHGSLPFKANNAAIKLAEAVTKLYRYPLKAILTDEYRKMVRNLPIHSLARTLLLHPLTLKKALNLLYKTSPGLARHLHAISRMTVSPNMICAGNKINVIPDRGNIDLDIRLLPGQTIEDVIREINKALGSVNENFNVEVVDFFPSNTSPMETPLFDATLEILRSIYPGITHIPSLFSGVTDARFWRRRGTVAYGFSLFDENMTLNEYARMLHGKDERISLKSLELTYNYFLNLPEAFFRKVAGGNYS
ncbi:MAG: M20/M25/M40 family metallo-hydrolase [Spirochaetales bacterium]|nr:M20/M25/M40 family metallo-hydrolase [Spirochaetales bacterium]